MPHFTIDDEALTYLSRQFQPIDPETLPIEGLLDLLEAQVQNATPIEGLRALELSTAMLKACNDRAAKAAYLGSLM